MYCSRCGKKIMEYMLFCPFCGTEIVIPDQEAQAGAKPADNPPEAENDIDLEFSPLKLEESAPETDWREELANRKAAQEEQKKAEAKAEGEALKLDGHAPTLDGSAPQSAGDGTSGRKASDTYVPTRPMATEDIFMDTEDIDEYDRYDSDDDQSDDDDYDFEEDEGFFARHLRGLIALSLLLILLALCGIYAFSNPGQEHLARLNLSWKPEVYSRLGYEYYQNEDYNAAGEYYERALTRDVANYSYASSAAMAYITGGNNTKAEELLRKCVEINPTAVEPYIYLLNLYPNAAQRPASVTRLVQEGYTLTGDSRLDLGTQTTETITG